MACPRCCQAAEAPLSQAKHGCGVEVRSRGDSLQRQATHCYLRFALVNDVQPFAALPFYEDLLSREEDTALAIESQQQTKLPLKLLEDRQGVDAKRHRMLQILHDDRCEVLSRIRELLDDGHSRVVRDLPHAADGLCQDSGGPRVSYAKHRHLSADAPSLQDSNFLAVLLQQLVILVEVREASTATPANKRAALCASQPLCCGFSVAGVDGGTARYHDEHGVALRAFSNDEITRHVDSVGRDTAEFLDEAGTNRGKER
mmetsp:Transcript_32763/g.76852  ORF Transcript_32763/g.76852 Transcript_32763/m.76852 type:complete len:258 (-) Transcript_32763:711-1484(-)